MSYNKSYRRININTNSSINVTNIELVLYSILLTILSTNECFANFVPSKYFHGFFALFHVSSQHFVVSFLPFLSLVPLFSGIIFDIVYYCK